MANFVVNNLYQGASLSVEKIPTSIVSIINLEWPIQHNYYPPSHVHQVLYMGIPDGGWPGDNWIRSIVNIIDSLMALGPVYVHCFAGVSRSCMVVVAYLILHLGWTFHKAYDYIREVNPDCDMNEDFIEGLTILGVN